LPTAVAGRCPNDQKIQGYQTRMTKQA
jgi:hypothetical protein